MGDGWIVKHLHAATGIYQSQADAQLIRAASSATGYRKYLGRAYGFERGVEAALAGVRGLEPACASRAKSSVLAGDLAALGMTEAAIAALPTCTAACDAITDLQSAAGWLFVVERASFAHRVAHQQLDPAIGKTATAFLDALLARTAWPELLRLLDRVTSVRGGAEAVIAGATRAFRTHRAWFRRTRTSTTLSRPKSGEVPVTPSEEPDGGCG